MASDERSKLGPYLKARRAELGLSLRDIGEPTGIASAHLSQIEKGRVSHPGVPTLSRVAEAYRLPIEALLGDVYGIGEGRTVDEKAAEIGRMVLELSEAQRTNTIGWIRFQLEHPNQ